MLRAGGGGNGELVFIGDRVSVWKDEQVLEMDGGDGYSALSIFNAIELNI